MSQNDQTFFTAGVYYVTVDYSTFRGTHCLSFVLKVSSLVSVRKLSGSLLYQHTEAQHQLLLVTCSVHQPIDGGSGAPAAVNVAAAAVACLVLG